MRSIMIASMSNFDHAANHNAALAGRFWVCGGTLPRSKVECVLIAASARGNFSIRQTSTRKATNLSSDAMKHPEIQWNSETKEWFCVRCFRTSDHISREEAVIELSQFECIAANGSEPDSSSVQ